MKIVITGSNGFVGSNLLNYLKGKLNDIVTINLRNTNWKSEIDLNSLAIIHLAGMAHDLKNNTNSEEYFKINTQLTQELFDVFLESSCRDFIYFSSVKAVTDNTDSIVSEVTISNPKTAYGQSKLKAEEYLLSKQLTTDKRIIIIRPTMIYGPKNKGNLNLLYKLVCLGLPWPLGVYKNRRSFCSIENLCFVINKILENDKISSGIYNVADDESISTNELIQLIANSINKKPRIIFIPKKIIFIIAKIGDILRLPLNTERLNKLTENFMVSNAKIKTALKIESFPVSTKEGIIKTIKFIHNN